MTEKRTSYAQRRLHRSEKEILSARLLGKHGQTGYWIKKWRKYSGTTSKPGESVIELLIASETLLYAFWTPLTAGQSLLTTPPAPTTHNALDNGIPRHSLVDDDHFDLLDLPSSLLLPQSYHFPWLLPGQPPSSQLIQRDLHVVSNNITLKQALEQMDHFQKFCTSVGKLYNAVLAQVDPTIQMEHGWTRDHARSDAGQGEVGERGRSSTMTRARSTSNPAGAFGLSSSWPNSSQSAANLQNLSVQSANSNTAEAKNLMLCAPYSPSRSSLHRSETTSRMQCDLEGIQARLKANVTSMLPYLPSRLSKAGQASLLVKLKERQEWFEVVTLKALALFLAGAHFDCLTTLDEELDLPGYLATGSNASSNARPHLKGKGISSFVQAMALKGMCHELEAPHTPVPSLPWEKRLSLLERPTQPLTSSRRDAYLKALECYKAILVFIPSSPYQGLPPASDGTKENSNYPTKIYQDPTLLENLPFALGHLPTTLWKSFEFVWMIEEGLYRGAMIAAQLWLEMESPRDATNEARPIGRRERLRSARRETSRPSTPVHGSGPNINGILAPISQHQNQTNSTSYNLNLPSPNMLAPANLPPMNSQVNLCKSLYNHLQPYLAVTLLVSSFFKSYIQVVPQVLPNLVFRPYRRVAMCKWYARVLVVWRRMMQGRRGMDAVIAEEMDPLAHTVATASAPTYSTAIGLNDDTGEEPGAPTTRILANGQQPFQRRNSLKERNLGQSKKRLSVDSTKLKADQCLENGSMDRGSTKRTEPSIVVDGASSHSLSGGPPSPTTSSSSCSMEPDLEAEPLDLESQPSIQSAPTEDHFVHTSFSLADLFPRYSDIDHILKLWFAWVTEITGFPAASTKMNARKKLVTNMVKRMTTLKRRPSLTSERRRSADSSLLDAISTTKSDTRSNNIPPAPNATEPESPFGIVPTPLDKPAITQSVVIGNRRMHDFVHTLMWTLERSSDERKIRHESFFPEDGKVGQIQQRTLTWFQVMAVNLDSSGACSTSTELLERERRADIDRLSRILTFLHGSLHHTFHSLCIMRYLFEFYLLFAKRPTYALNIIRRYMDLARERFLLHANLGDIAILDDEEDFEDDDSLMTFVETILLGSKAVCMKLGHVKSALLLSRTAKEQIGVVTRYILRDLGYGRKDPKDLAAVPLRLRVWVAKAMRRAGSIYLYASRSGMSYETRQKLNAQALSLFERALDWYPRSSLLLYSLALAKAERKDVTGAIGLVKKSLKVRRRFPAAWHLLILLMSEQKQYETVLKLSGLAVKECKEHFIPASSSSCDISAMDDIPSRPGTGINSLYESHRSTMERHHSNETVDSFTPSASKPHGRTTRRNSKSSMQSGSVLLYGVKAPFHPRTDAHASMAQLYAPDAAGISLEGEPVETAKTLRRQPTAHNTFADLLNIVRRGKWKRFGGEGMEGGDELWYGMPSEWRKGTFGNDQEDGDFQVAFDSSSIVTVNLLQLFQLKLTQSIAVERVRGIIPAATVLKEAFLWFNLCFGETEPLSTGSRAHELCHLIDDRPFYSADDIVAFIDDILSPMVELAARVPGNSNTSFKVLPSLTETAVYLRRLYSQPTWNDVRNQILAQLWMRMVDTLKSLHLFDKAFDVLHALEMSLLQAGALSHPLGTSPQSNPTKQSVVAVSLGRGSSRCPGVMSADSNHHPLIVKSNSLSPFQSCQMVSQGAILTGEEFGHRVWKPSHSKDGSAYRAPRRCGSETSMSSLARRPTGLRTTNASSDTEGTDTRYRKSGKPRLDAKSGFDQSTPSPATTALGSGGRRRGSLRIATHGPSLKSGPIPFQIGLSQVRANRPMHGQGSHVRTSSDSVCHLKDRTNVHQESSDVSGATSRGGITQSVSVRGFGLIQNSAGVNGSSSWKGHKVTRNGQPFSKNDTAQSWSSTSASLSFTWKQDFSVPAASSLTLSTITSNGPLAFQCLMSVWARYADLLLELSQFARASFVLKRVVQLLKVETIDTELEPDLCSTEGGQNGSLSSSQNMSRRRTHREPDRQGFVQTRGQAPAPFEDYYDVVLGLAKSLLWTGDEVSAEAVLKELLKVYIVDSTEAWYILGLVHKAKGEPEKVRECMLFALETEKTEPIRKMDVLPVWLPS